MVNRITLPLADWVGIASLASAGDAQLLHRFAKAGEQQAFAMLVKRHGPMVWGVTRRLLRSHQDAEDAFQATFLVLAKKAGSVRKPQLLANWLHGVAHRTALQLRSRRKILAPLEPEHEPADDTPDHVAWRECGMVIDRAIEELPSSLRIVFLLCQAEGLTTLAASKRLNLPEGTVVSRLHRARKQLQGLLARHGITSAAGAVTLGWSLALPEVLSAFTVRTLLGSAPSALVAGLAQGVLTTMMWIKLTTAAVVVSTVGLVGAGAATFIAKGQGDKAALQTAVAQPPAKSASKDDRIRQLEKLFEVKTAEYSDRLAMSEKLMQSVKKMLDDERSKNEKLKQLLEAQAKKTEAVQQFLEKDLLAQESKSKNAQEDHAREAEKRARQQDEERQQRRTMDLMKAKEQLTNEIDQLQKECATMEDNVTKETKRSQLITQAVGKNIEEASKQIKDAQERAPAEDEIIKGLKKKLLEMLETEQSKQNARSQNMKKYTTTMHRLEAQLKLRDKLLLEVDEKLLRMQLKLDEK